MFWRTVPVRRAVVVRLPEAWPKEQLTDHGWLEGHLTDGLDGVRAALGLVPGTRPGFAHRFSTSGRIVRLTADWLGSDAWDVQPWQVVHAYATLGACRTGLSDLDDGLLVATAAACDLEPHQIPVELLASEAMFVVWPEDGQWRFAMARGGVSAPRIAALEASGDGFVAALAALFAIAWRTLPSSWLRHLGGAGPAAGWRFDESRVNNSD